MTKRYAIFSKTLRLTMRTKTLFNDENLRTTLTDLLYVPIPFILQCFTNTHMSLVKCHRSKARMSLAAQ